MAGKMTAIEAAVKVLTDAGKPLTVPEIIAKAVPLTSLKGETPGQTIYSVLYAEAKKSGGRVKQVGKGTFKLGAPAKPKSPAAAKTPKRSTAKRTTAKRAPAAKKRSTAKRAPAKKRSTAKSTAKKRSTSRQAGSVA